MMIIMDHSNQEFDDDDCCSSGRSGSRHPVEKVVVVDMFCLIVWQPIYFDLLNR